MKLFARYFLWFLSLFTLAIATWAWQSAAPGFLKLLSWPLLALLIAFWLKGEKDWLWPAFFLGLLLDIMSFGFFGWNMFIWPLLAILLRFLSRNFFSSRSAYSFLLLTVVLTITYYFLLSLVAYFFFFFSSFPLFHAWYWRNIALGAWWNTLALFIFFIFFRRRRRHFDLA